MHLLITGHQSLANRGCEALLRSTVDMVRSRHPHTTFAVPSTDAKADAAQWPEAFERGVRWIPAPSISWPMQAWAKACERLPALATAPWPLPPLDSVLSRELDRCDAMLSIGGDNYTLDYDLASLALYVGMAEHAQQRRIPTVLWGASLGPFDAQAAVARRMADHLKRFSAVTVRESLSKDVLQRLLWPQEGSANGLQVHTVADPAFTLRTQAVNLEPHWPSGDGPVLGLNISPLALPSGSTDDPREALLQAATTFIRRVVEQEQGRVVLVPHVSARNADGHDAHALHPRTDDARLLDELMARLPDMPRVTRLPVWNAAQLKHAISHCDLFIGARTHAVIAALSSGVPAVALSYSLKARGIHRDLLGHENGVLPAATISADSLYAAWCELRERHAQEQRLLQQRLPAWRQRALSGLAALEEVA